MNVNVALEAKVVAVATLVVAFGVFVFFGLVAAANGSNPRYAGERSPHLESAVSLRHTYWAGYEQRAKSVLENIETGMPVLGAPKAGLDEAGTGGLQGRAAYALKRATDLGGDCVYLDQLALLVDEQADKYPASSLSAHYRNELPIAATELAECATRNA